MYNNGVSETRAYNTDNTLASISFTGADIGDLAYGWDANKNKTSETIGGTMSGYGFSVGTTGYDDEDRLESWNRPSVVRLRRNGTRSRDNVRLRNYVVLYVALNPLCGVL